MAYSVNKISDELVIEALQIVHNYCTQEASNCAECILHMEDTTCLFWAELPDRFDKWKKENGIQMVGRQVRRRKK